jgi:hypothetical protein
MLKWVVSQGRSLVLMATPRLRIRIILANGAILGPTKIAVLEAIEATGSIHAAARLLGFFAMFGDRYNPSTACYVALPL